MLNPNPTGSIWPSEIFGMAIYQILLFEMSEDSKIKTFSGKGNGMYYTWWQGG